MDIARPGPSVLTLAFQPLRNVFLFSGRSTRTEVVGYFILATLMNLVTITVYGPAVPLLDAAKLVWAILWAVPWIALFVRRLHDQDRSGLWALTFLADPLLSAAMRALPQEFHSGTWGAFSWVSHAALTPPAFALLGAAIAVAIFQLVLFLLPGTPGTNRYGLDPREEAPVPA